MVLEILKMFHISFPRVGIKLLAHVKENSVFKSFKAHIQCIRFGQLQPIIVIYVPQSVEHSTIVLNVRDASGVLSPKLFQENLFGDSKRLSVVYARTHICAVDSTIQYFLLLVRTRVSKTAHATCYCVVNSNLTYDFYASKTIEFYFTTPECTSWS